MSPPRSRPPRPPPGEFMVRIQTGVTEVIERLCANEQEGWRVFYDHCGWSKADVRLIRNGTTVARRYPPKESIPS